MAFSPETYALLAGKGGGGGGGESPFLLVHMTNLVCDKTWNEINTALLSGKPSFILNISDNIPAMYPVNQTYEDDGFILEMFGDGGNAILKADSANGYPVWI